MSQLIIPFIVEPVHLCKECLTVIDKEKCKIPGFSIYECPKCWYPNSDDDLYERV